MYKMRLCVFTVRILYTQIMYSNVCVRLQKRFRFEWTQTVFFPRYGKIKKNRTTTDVLYLSRQLVYTPNINTVA